MKQKNSPEQEECSIIGEMSSKKEKGTLHGITKRNQKTGQIGKMTTNDFIKKANIKHNNKYDYTNSKYTGCQSKIEIICPIHGNFWQTATIHLIGKECVKCGHIKTHTKSTQSTSQWIEKSNEIHNFKYDYSQSQYKKSHLKVKIVCPSHGSFQQTPDCHLQGRGCPKCNLSKAEEIIKRWLDKHNILHEVQKTFDDCKNPRTNYKLKFDFYIPARNLLIEYDGEQHFNPILIGKYQITQERVDQTQYRDSIKTNYAKKSGIDLLRISYKEFNHISKILSESIPTLHCGKTPEPHLILTSPYLSQSYTTLL
jgi:very-short-patch-repair endonuclease